jgi:hypothetical protein
MVSYTNGLASGVGGPGPIFVNVDPDGLGPAGFGPQIFVTNSNVGSISPITPQDVRGITAKPILSWDRSFGINRGRVYMVYTARSSPLTNDTDIFVRFSDNNGSSWSLPTRVNDDSTSNSQFFPQIAVDQKSGFVACSWYDCRFDFGQGGINDRDGVPNTDANMFAAVSFDGGLSFGPNVQITSAPSNAANLNVNSGNQFGDYTGLCFDRGVLHPAWCDNSVTLPGGVPPIFTIATAAITVPLGPDRYEFNETTDKATQFGVLPRGTQTYKLLNVFQHPSRLPDYDCYRWTAGARGTVTVTLQVSGELELHLFTLVGNTLVQVSQDLGRNFGATTRQAKMTVQKGQTIIVQVKGRNFALGYHEQGAYGMTIQLK